MRTSICALAFAALVATTGCIDYEEVIHLKADGSGEVEMTFVMQKEFIERMRAFSEQMGEADEQDVGPFTEFCSEEEIRAELRLINSGLELKSYERNENEEELGFKLQFSFTSQDDLEDLKHACPESYGDDEDDAPGFSFTYEPASDGRWRFARALGDMGSGPPPMDASDYSGAEQDGDTAPDGMDPEAMQEAMKQMEEVMAQLQESNPEAARQMEAQMQALTGGADLEQSMAKAAEEMGDHHIRFEVHFPAEVVASNATSTQSRVAIWDFPLDRMPSAPEELEAFIQP